MATFVISKLMSRFESTLTPPASWVKTFPSIVIVVAAPLGLVLGEAEGLDDGDGDDDGDELVEADGDVLGDVDGEALAVADGEELTEGDALADSDGDALTDAEGLLDGDDDGLGELDGEVDGDSLGVADGLLEGDAETDVLGLALTLVLGDSDGVADGEDDGLADGDALGDAEAVEEGDVEGLEEAPPATLFPKYSRNMDHAVVGMLITTSSHSAGSVTSRKRNTTLSAFISVLETVTFSTYSPALSCVGVVARFAKAPLSFLTLKSSAWVVGVARNRPVATLRSAT